METWVSACACRSVSHFVRPWFLLAIWELKGNTCSQTDHEFLTNVISYCFFFGRRKESGCWQLFLIFVLWRSSVLKCKDFSSSSFDYRVNYITSIFASSPLACIKCYSRNTSLTEIWTLNLLKWIISQLFLLLWKERHFAIWHLAVIYSTSKSSFRAAQHIWFAFSIFLV